MQKRTGKIFYIFFLEITLLHRLPGSVFFPCGCSISRGKGLGKEAVKLMMVYAMQCLNIGKFRAKIDDMNVPSRNLFERLVWKHHFLMLFMRL